MFPASYAACACADRGPVRANMSKQPGEKGDVARIGHAYLEASWRRRRIECLRTCGETSQQRKRLACRADQRVGTGDGLHPGRRAHEKGVVPLAAKLPEPYAGGRLAQVEPLGRAGHALGAVDLVEQDEHPGVAWQCAEFGVHNCEMQ